MPNTSARGPLTTRWSQRIVVALVATLSLSGLALASPLSASAATVVTSFDTVAVTANPNAWAITGITNTINGSTAGGDFGRIFTGQQPATGVVVEYGFTTPAYQVTGLRLFNNGGGILTDFDGIGSALVEVLDPSNVVLFSGTLNAGNGGAFFATNFPGPLDNVAIVRLSNITNLAGHAAPDIIWRELQVVQNVSTPAISTQINADGYSDDVTVSATEGIDGSLDWTLFGPVAAGPGDSCAAVSWVGASEYAGGTIAVTGDGPVVTTPPVAPTAPGCYSYADVLSGPAYTADAVSAVGQPAETFFVAPPPDPSISLVKSATPNDAASFVEGQVITYSFVVENTGNVPLTDVAVAETSFSGSGALSAITCPGGNGSVMLAVGAQVTCTATYTVTQLDVDSGSLENTATATGTPPVGEPVESPESSTAVPGDPAPALVIEKSVTPGAATAAGQLLNYSFLLTNTGNVTLSNATVVEDTFSGSDPLGSIACPPAAATLLPGAQATCTATYTLTQADVDAGTVTNSAHGSATAPGGAAVTSTVSDADVEIPAAPAISLAKSASPTTITAAGQTVTYSFLVTNEGNVTLDTIAVDDTGFTGDGTLSAITCPSTGPLTPDAELTCTATYITTQADVDNGNAFTNTATVSGEPPIGGAVESEPSTSAVDVDAESAISLEKAAVTVDTNANGRTDAGDHVSWRITVSNDGATSLSEIVVTDPSAGAVACPATVLAPSATMTCTVAARLVTEADATAGEITNAASVTALQPDGEPLTAEAEAILEVSATALALTGANRALPIGLGALVLLATGVGAALLRRRVGLRHS